MDSNTDSESEDSTELDGACSNALELDEPELPNYETSNTFEQELIEERQIIQECLIAVENDCEKEAQKILDHFGILRDKLVRVQFLDITNMFADGNIFVVCGDSLLLSMMGDEHFNCESGGQMLHLTYLCERLLQMFSRKGGQFEVIFFNIWRFCWAGNHSALLARAMLQAHFQHNALIRVHEFRSVWDSKFKEFLNTRKPSFMLVDFNLPSIYLNFIAKQNMTLANSTFDSQLLFSVVHDLPCVDMRNVCIGVSTFHAFIVKGVAGLKKKLLKIIQRLDKAIKKEIHKLESMQTLWKENFKPEFAKLGQDARHNITVIAAAWYLLDESSSIHKEDWVRVFLLYTALLEVLPLKWRGLQAPLIEPNPDLVKFIDQIHCHMHRAVASIAEFNYKYDNIADLWHGNLFLNTLVCLSPSFSSESMFSVGHQTEKVYKQLVHEVSSIVGNNLEMLPINLKNLHLCTSKNEKKIKARTEISSSSQTPLSDLKILIPTACQLTHEFCGELLLELFQQAREYGFGVDKFISRNNEFDELHHWHSRKTLTDEHDRIKSDLNLTRITDSYVKKQLLKQQAKYATYMSHYGSNIEGRPLTHRPIVCNKKKSKKNKQSSKALKLIQENLDSKKKYIEAADERELFEFQKIFRINEVKRDYELLLCEVNKLIQNLTTDHCIQRGLMFRAKIYRLIWHDECNRKMILKRDLTSAKELFLVLRRILTRSKMKLPLTTTESNQIGDWLCELGFIELAKKWELPMQQQGGKFATGMSWVRFQLTELGPELERVSEGVPDSRVDFVPDPWQRELFDIIDNRQSAVVVAPTSSGKTYASYYCMESILREDDEGIVVYVSPTKALVNQVAATVYARFKDKKMPPGKSVSGVFTRDYRTNEITCQILVTVPQCLELLLLSPRRHSWVQRIRYVIFDEVHCLAGQAGGISWECGLLLIQCPFLALSATIQKPEILHNWLQSAQKFKQERDKLDGCVRKPKSYEVHLVVYKERHNDLKNYVYSSVGDLQHLHPYSQIDSLIVEQHGGIPSNISLSPEETVQLYSSMEDVAPDHPEVMKLCPETFFQGSGFLTRSDAKRYAEKLRRVLEHWAFEDTNSFDSVIELLQFNLEPCSGDQDIVDNLIKFVQHLEREEMFPAIFFSYNRKLIDLLFEKLTKHYRDMVDNTSDGDMYVGESEDTHLRKSKSKEMKVSYKEKYKKWLSLVPSQSCRTLRSTRSVVGSDIEFIERRLINSGYKSNSLFINGLQVGLGKHHSGMNNKERSAVEMLFRMKVLSLVFATGTLSLGIHMPCKTVVIAGDSIYLNCLEYHQMSGRAGRRGFDTSGNVIFFGLEDRKRQTLLTGKLPCMIGNIPLSVTFVLKLLLLVSKVTVKGAQNKKTTSIALSRALVFLNCSLVYQEIPDLKHQMKHFFAFSTQLLIIQGLLDDQGNPQILTGLVTHLQHHEPGNLAFVYLFRSGALRRLCKLDQNSSVPKELQKTMILVLSYLFTQTPLHASDKTRKYNNSKVILPPLPADIKQEINKFNEVVSHVYAHYFQQVARHCARTMEEDDTLPLSNVRLAPSSKFEPTSTEITLETEIMKRSEPREICSAFAALSGHTDKELYSYSNAIANIRHQVYTDVKMVPHMDCEQVLNAYAWDFYNHGIYSAIEKDNGLRAGDAFKLLKDFMLVLRTIYVSLIELEACDENDPVLLVFKVITNTFSELFHKAFNTKWEPL